jgi:hypothetical protein
MPSAAPPAALPPAEDLVADEATAAKVVVGPGGFWDASSFSRMPLPEAAETEEVAPKDSSREDSPVRLAAMLRSSCTM